MFLDANGKLYLPRLRWARKPKYNGQKLTEKYRRRAFFAKRRGDVRVLADGTRYERNPQTGVWTKIRQAAGIRRAA